MKPRAFCYIRDLPHYRRESFVAGLAAAGYEVDLSGRADYRAGDVLLIWNRYGAYHELALRAERAGATVLVSENGFAGRDAQGRQFYQLAVGGHNGSGSWRVGESDRLAAQGLTVAPWQATTPTAPVVVRGQRGIGRAGVASPPDWHNRVAEYLRQHTRRPIIVVPHPGNGAVDNRDHERYLRGAHALVIWSSSVGVKALLAGVPVISMSPYWVCGPTPSIELMESDFLRSEAANAVRLEMLRRMAWAQWSLDEIATGWPIKHLLQGCGATQQAGCAA